MTTCVEVPLGPACVNLKGARTGDANPVKVTLKAGGVPINLTTANIEAQARKKATDPDPPAMTAGVTSVDLPNGVVVLTWDVPRDIFGGKATWTGVWDLQVDDRTVVAGTFAADYDVTRPP